MESIKIRVGVMGSAGGEFAAYEWSTGATTRAITVVLAEDASYELTVLSEAGCSATASVDVVTLPDIPVVESVTSLRLTKQDDGGLRLSFPDIGAAGYNLHMAATAAELATSEPIAWSASNEIAIDPPPSGGLQPPIPALSLSCQAT